VIITKAVTKSRCIATGVHLFLEMQVNFIKVAPRLSLPGKLVFPSNQNLGHFSMLGLGDIVMPGLLLCFVMRYDAYKRAQVLKVTVYTKVA
jgi:presenilin-like A22 family membrane protease